MHWGNIGSAYGIWKHGPGWLQQSQDRQKAQADAARAETALADEEARQLRLERRRRLHGWSLHGIDTFATALVTTPEEMDQAREELTSGGPTSYVIMRVAEGEGRYGGANRALRLRQIIESEGFISRPPDPGEREALQAGVRTLTILEENRAADRRAADWQAADRRNE